MLYYIILCIICVCVYAFVYWFGIFALRDDATLATAGKKREAFFSSFFMRPVLFFPHGTTRQANSYGASVATGRRMPTQSKTFARDIFAHTHTDGEKV